MSFLRQQTLQQQMQVLEPTPDIAPKGEEYKALLTPYKHTRKGTDGTTIIFYDFDDALSGQKYEDLAKSNKSGITLFFPPDEALKNSFKDWASQIEDIADVRFFDINNQTIEDKKYLSVNGVTTPEKADVVLKYADKEEMSKEKMEGYANYPGTSLRFIVVSDFLREYNRAPTETVGHEMGHIMGLEHPHGAGKSPGRYGTNMSSEHDNIDNTIMTYINKQVEDFGRHDTYEEDDISALQDIYGISKKGKDYYIDNVKKPRDRQKELEAVGSLIFSEERLENSLNNAVIELLNLYLQEASLLVPENERPTLSQAIRENKGIDYIKKHFDDSSKISGENGYSDSNPDELWEYIIHNRLYGIEACKKAYNNAYQDYSKNLTADLIPEEDKVLLADIFSGKETYSYSALRRFEIFEREKLDKLITKEAEKDGNNNEINSTELNEIMTILKNYGVKEISLINEDFAKNIDITTQNGIGHYDFNKYTFSSDIKTATTSFLK